MKIKKLITLASLLSTSIALASCSSSNMPYIGENGNWFVNGVDQGVSAQGPKGDQGDKGDKGDKGDQGNPGNTPYIGSNGNWWIGNTDTGIKVDYSGTISPEPEDSEKKERATELKSYINSLIEKTPNHVPAWNTESFKGRWNYIDGVILKSIVDYSNMTHDNSYMDFVVKYTDYYLKDTGFVKIDEKGEIISTDQAIGMEVKQMNDSLCESIILFDLKNYNGKEKYKNAIDFSYNALMEFGEKRVPGTNCFWHKEAYTDQLWLDGFYMYAPFYARYAKENNSNAIFDEITDQFQSARALLRDDRTGLYYHGYAANYRDLSDDTIFWANRETGRSQSFWGRGLGWYVMALVDILEYFPEGENKESLKQMLNEALTAVYNYRDIETNMYYNVLNYNELDLPYDGLIGNNYLETSGSSMISYAMIKGARLNYIDKAFKERGLATFDGIYNHSFNNSSLGNICKVAGLGGTKADGSLNTKRTGTPRYYCSEKIVNDDAKGVGPFIMAFMEYLKA